MRRFFCHAVFTTDISVAAFRRYFKGLFVAVSFGLIGLQTLEDLVSPFVELLYGDHLSCGFIKSLNKHLNFLIA